MSSQNNKGRFSTTKLGQWLGLTRPKLLTEYECYMKIWGDLIYAVDFYVEKAPMVELLRDCNKILDKIFEDNHI